MHVRIKIEKTKGTCTLWANEVEKSKTQETGDGN